MKYVNELKREIGATQQQVVEWKKNESANALKEVRSFCKEFGFYNEMLKGLLTEKREKK